jgi:circadian clock protein KaiC
MSVESPDLFGSARVTDQPLSHMADNVLLLSFVRGDGEYRRAITVLKSRAAAADPRATEYTIGSKGIALRSPRSRAVAH